MSRSFQMESREEARVQRNEQVQEEGEHDEVAYDAIGRMAPIRIPAVTDGETEMRMKTWRSTTEDESHAMSARPPRAAPAQQGQAVASPDTLMSTHTT